MALTFQAGQITLNEQETKPLQKDVVGSKELTKRVNFPNPMVDPKVAVALAGLDAFAGEGTPNPTNVRVSLGVSNVDNTGFDLQIVTWHTSKIYRIAVTWMAYVGI
jgi:hypothetical protein